MDYFDLISHLIFILFYQNNFNICLEFKEFIIYFFNEFLLNNNIPITFLGESNRCTSISIMGV